VNKGCQSGYAVKSLDWNSCIKTTTTDVTKPGCGTGFSSVVGYCVASCPSSDFNDYADRCTKKHHTYDIGTPLLCPAGRLHVGISCLSASCRRRLSEDAPSWITNPADFNPEDEALQIKSFLADGTNDSRDTA